MTGEISLRGRVLPVGGIKQVLLPEHNRKDWAEVPGEAREKMTVHFVRRISELLPLALVEATATKAKKDKTK